MLLACLARPADAQERAGDEAAQQRDTVAATGDTTALREAVVAEPVVVTVTRAEKEELKAPRAIATVRPQDIQIAQRTLTLDESLSRVPGTLAQNRNNFSIGERLSIRGFGARAAFGIRGIELVVDGIPQTLADGQSVSSNIDLASAGRIEVLRGPSSSLYGNAAGGVVNITTEPPPTSPTLSSTFTGGAFDLQKYLVKLAGRAAGDWGYVVDANRLEYDGFRDHSQVESTLVNARLTYAPEAGSEWAAIVNYNDTPVAQSPGSLTREQAEADPSQANPRNVATRSGETHHQAQVGLSYRREISETQTFAARLYGLDREVRNPLPFAVIAFDRVAGGGGLQYVLEAPLFGLGTRLTAGADLDVQNDDRRNFENVEGREGAETLDQDELVTAVGIYLQNETLLAEALELTLGVRYDRVRFRVDDRFLEDGNDDSGVRTLDQGAVDLFDGLGVSPMAGLRYSPTPAVNLYANVSTSFQTPTTTELANRPTGAGGFNPDLEPEKARSYELGIKGVLADAVIYTVAGFLMDVRDELIPFEVPNQPQRQFFRNAGSAQHNGIEASLEAQINDWLRGSVAYAYSNFFFDEFRTADAEFDGNDIPGVPPHRVFGQLGYEDARSIFAVLEAEIMDDYFVDDANTTENDGYTSVSARAGWTGEIGGIEWRPFVGVNNLFDEEYSGSVVVNAVGGRFFEPSPGRNAYGGLSVAYRF